MADTGSKARLLPSARSRAMVVFPMPGGPHRAAELRCCWTTVRPSGASGARRWSCPTTSFSRVGRRR
ncbi:hypothetical protein ASE41_17595 [Streptomyces sp. Root264]|nr:hypothetical protein ASE41_17595 [Streptomyces sp. Root264]